MNARYTGPIRKSQAIITLNSGYAWNTVSIDVVGPLPVSIGKAKYIIVAIDGLTKWVEACTTSNIYDSTVTKSIINQIIVCHGCPSL